MSAAHIPVLLNEVLDAFGSMELHYFIDGTVGAGGHAESLLQAHHELVSYVAIDQDPSALQIAEKRLQPWTDKVDFVHSNFAQLRQIAQQKGVARVDGIVLDIGVSSMQLDQPDRGFSLRFAGPLDMRMNPEDPVTAADIVNTWSQEDLGRLFWRYGEERRWPAAARAIVQKRAEAPIQTTDQLVDVLQSVLRPRKNKRGIHPATLIFQALRIAVNKELDVLETALQEAVELLLPGGRLAVITFHSLEDRLVKQTFRELASDKISTEGHRGVFIDKDPIGKLVNRKAIKASEEEIELNPRSRSARLRVLQKLHPTTQS